MGTEIEMQRTATGLGLCCGVLFALTACGGSGDYQIERVRETGRAVQLGKSVQERSFEKPAPSGRGIGTEQTVADLLEWKVPSGWEQLPARQFRAINLRAGEVECYVSVLTAGGVADNVNRWRGQMGQPPLGAEQIAALQTTTLLERDAHRLDIEGTFSGRGGEGHPGYRMLAVYAQFPTFAMSVKMIGPAAAVATQVAAFDEFCSSLGFDREKANSIASEPGGRAHGGGAGKLAYDVPSGWTRQAPRATGVSPRHASFDLGGGAECYVTYMPGTAGGVGPNINRWLGQVDLPALDGAGLAALPSLKILGQQSPFLEALGPQNSVLATLTTLPGRTMFVKLTGPTTAVTPHKARFVAFCESLREDQ